MAINRTAYHEFSIINLYDRSDTCKIFYEWFNICQQKLLMDDGCQGDELSQAMAARERYRLRRWLPERDTSSDDGCQRKIPSQAMAARERYQLRRLKMANKKQCIHSSYRES